MGFTPLGFDIKRVSIAGKVSGMELKNPKNLKVIPYVIGQHIRDKANSLTASTPGDAGADINTANTRADT